MLQKNNFAPSFNLIVSPLYWLFT